MASWSGNMEKVGFTLPLIIEGLFSSIISCGVASSTRLLSKWAKWVYLGGLSSNGRFITRIWEALRHVATCLPMLDFHQSCGNELASYLLEPSSLRPSKIISIHGPSSTKWFDSIASNLHILANPQRASHIIFKVSPSSKALGESLKQSLRWVHQTSHTKVCATINAANNELVLGSQIGSGS